jgi:hypothetical protein
MAVSRMEPGIFLTVLHIHISVNSEWFRVELLEAEHSSNICQKQK